ncbi:MAG: oxidoreductase, partial [Gammaproteobacteria bacterium]|nr:oxidoreductase [Gammaproteobacteria bacterium]
WNEARQLPQHWIFDAHLLDNGWAEPRCVTVCASGAMRSLKVDDEEMADLKAREGLEELQPESATKPRVHYKNLKKFTHEFVGGTIINTINGVTDCVADVTVKLERGGSVVGEAVTDAYGEFKIDGLPTASGAYGVVIEVGGHVAKRLDIDLDKSVYLGRIDLAA